MAYDWPGNVRELVNVIERAVVIARDDYITVSDLPFKGEAVAATDARKPAGSLRESLEELEKRLIGEAMDKAADNQTRAAELLGMSERMLRYKLKKYDLKN